MAKQERVRLKIESDDEDAFGTVYNVKPKPSVFNYLCNPKAFIILSMALFCVLFGYLFGYFAGEQEIVNIYSGYNNAGTVGMPEMPVNGDLIDDPFGAAGGNGPGIGQAISLQQRCANLRCCQYRDPEQHSPVNGINCISFKVEACTENDDVCVWDCDEFQIPAKRRGKFKGFDQGNGHIREDKQFANGNGGGSGDRGPPQTIDEIIARGSISTFGSCGEVYEFEMPRDIARGILDDERTRFVSKGPNGNRPNLDDLPNNNNERDEELERRRLGITGADGRSQSSSTTLWAKRVGLLRTDSGGWCTGTLISRRVVLTAAHCVYDTGSDSSTGGLTFYPNVVNSNLGIGIRALTAAVPNRWIAQEKNADGSYVDWSASRDCDYAVVRLKPANTGIGWATIGYSEGMTGSLNTYGYPEDKSYGTRWRQYCEHQTWMSEQTRSTTCDTARGMSGGPHYKYWSSSNTRIQYAITSGGGSTTNYYSRINQLKLNTICGYISQGEVAVC